MSFSVSAFPTKHWHGPAEQSLRLRDWLIRDKALREVAEKVRGLARQTWIAEAREELFELADRLDRMAERAKTSHG